MSIAEQHVFDRLSDCQGPNIVRLMREHRVTIRELARRMDVSQRRVRDIRNYGTGGFGVFLDCWEAITGLSYRTSPRLTTLFQLFREAID